VAADNAYRRERLAAEQIAAAERINEIRSTALSTYAAAEKRRTDKDWRPQNKSADQAIVPDVATVNARARMACRDDWGAKSGQGGYVRHVVGTGITPRADARDPATDEELAEFNKAAMKLWERWARNPAACDIEGRKDFLAIERLIARELYAVGECLVMPVIRSNGARVGITVQLIEPEQLDTTVMSTTEREVRGGVEVNEYGAATAYHVFTKSHPLETYGKKSQRIAAERIFHVIDPERIRQTRGISRMSAVLKRQYHLGMYDEYELLAKKAESCIGMVIKQDPVRALGEGMLNVSGGADATGVDSTEKDNEEWRMEPLMMPKLLPGEEMQPFVPQRPGAGYGPWTAQQITQNAAGVGLDAAMVARDYSKANFGGQRQGLIETWSELDPIAMLLINVALRGVWEMFVAVAVLEGKLDAPKFFSDPEWHEAYLEAAWGLTAKQWIDPAKQGAGAKIKLDAGLTSRQRILNELGIDWRAVLREEAEYKAFAEKLGITIPGVNAPSKVSPSEPRPTRRPDGSGDDEDEGEDEDDDEGREKRFSAAIDRAVGEYAGVR